TEMNVIMRLCLSQIFVRIDEHYAVHHADFVDNEVVTWSPIFLLVISYFFLLIFPDRKTGSTMKGRALNVKSGGTRGSCDQKLILSIAGHKPSADGGY